MLPMLPQSVQLSQLKVQRFNHDRIEKWLIASFTLILIGTVAWLTAYIAYQMLVFGSKHSNNLWKIYVSASIIFTMAVFLYVFLLLKLIKNDFFCMFR